MAKGKKSGSGSGASNVVVMDNGGCTIKIGMGDITTEPRVLQNCALRARKTKQVLVADQLDEIVDFSTFYYRRPFDRGYPVDWDLERSIWKRAFGAGGIKIKTEDHPLLVTEPYFTPEPIQTTMDEVVFETFNFPSLCRIPSSQLAVRAYHNEQQLEAKSNAPTSQLFPYCCIVVDCGFSFSHVTPLVNLAPMQQGIRRVNLGGKHLTNYLKELVSYRAFNMMDETHVINRLKERACYVSLNFIEELNASRKNVDSIVKEYFLPNGSTLLDGCLREDLPSSLSDDEIKSLQTLRMTNERISVPEVLFNPSDIGLHQAGLGEAIVQAVEACDKSLHPLLYANILVVGGSSLFPNMQARLAQEVRSLAPTDFTVRVYAPQDPILCAWRGGALLAGDPAFSSLCVTKAQYQEAGSSITRRIFFPYQATSASSSSQDVEMSAK